MVPAPEHVRISEGGIWELAGGSSYNSEIKSLCVALNALLNLVPSSFLYILFSSATSLYREMTTNTC